jgi:predicted transposase YbfD/YdcC
MTLRAVSWLPILLMVVTLADAAQNRLITFNDMAAWQEKSFKGHTVYTVEKQNGKDVLHAKTTGNASGLYHKISLKARELPLLKWSWKVAHTIADEDATRKSGDDFAARIYLVFPGRFFWQTRALVYVYSDKLPPGTVLANAYTGNVAMIAVASGNSQAGNWRHESRRYVDDFRAFFHSEPPDPVAVAIMTDGDNTGSSAEAWYGDIIFAAE